MESPDLKRLEESILRLSPEDRARLAAWLQGQVARSRPETADGIDWSRYAGVIKQGPDPLVHQAERRAEWVRE